MYDCLLNQNLMLSCKAVTGRIESEWTLKWGMDGCFFEQFKMKNLLMKGAMTARLHGMLMLQGEVYVLSTWIRTGFWFNMKILVLDLCFMLPIKNSCSQSN